MRTPNVRVLTDRGAWQFARAFAVSLVNLAGRATPIRRRVARSPCGPSLCFFARSWRSLRTPPPRQDHLRIRYRQLARPDGQRPRQPAGRPCHHERRTDVDRPVGYDLRYAAERLRLHHDDTAAGHVARNRSVVPARNVYAPELRGRRPFPDVGSARRRARAGRGRCLDGAVDLHLQVQPRGNAEQPESLSVSDAGRRRVYGPGDDRFLGATHDVPGRWHRLHVVDGFSGQRTATRYPNSSREKAAPSTRRG